MNRSFVSRVLSASAVFALLAVVLAVPVRAQASQAAETNAKPVTHFGLLRVRDLTPFGFLRLDMRPAHAVSIEPGGWAIETEFASQNTWAMSPRVEEYLLGLEASGRRALGEEEVAAIHDLPGENYLVDLEMTMVDVTLHHQITPRLSAYLITSAVSYEGVVQVMDAVYETWSPVPGPGRPRAPRARVRLL